MGMENLNTTYKQNNEIPTVNPFNSNNKLITEFEVIHLLKKFGINENITNIKIYQQSFFHKSYIKKENNLNNKGERVELVECPSDCLELQIESNERLEFLGDSILGSTVAGYLYERFPDENEGFMTRLRTKLVNGEMLGKLAKEIKHSKIDFFSGLGFQICQVFIINIIEKFVDFGDLILNDYNYKDQLLKYFQHNFKQVPKYKQIS